MSIQKESFFSKEPYFLIALVAVTFITLYPFIFTGFATGDDIMFYLQSHKSDIWENALNHAKRNGRFFFTFIRPLFFELIPYGTGSYVFPKVVNTLLIVLNFGLFALIVKELFSSKWIAFLCYLIGFVFISIKGVNNPIVSYPIYFTFSFSFILFALYFAIKFQQSERAKYRILSAACLPIGFIFYENYLVYVPLIIGFIVYNKVRDTAEPMIYRMRKALVLAFPFIVSVVLYLGVYIYWRTMFGGHYKGSSIASDNSIWDFFSTVTAISRGAYPLYFYFSGHTIFSDNSYILSNHEHGLPYVFLHAKAEWIFKAVIVGLLFYYIIKKIEVGKAKKMIYIGLLAAVFIYAPQVILAFTEKYSTLVKCCGLNNYLTTYFSSFAVSLLLAIVLLGPLLLIRKERSKTIYKAFVAVLIGLASIVNDYANGHSVTDLNNIYYTFKAVDEFMKTEQFKNIPSHSGIYTPQLYKSNSEISYMFAQHFDWSDYFYDRSKKQIGVYGAIEEFSQTKASMLNHFYYMNYGHSRKSEDQFFAVAAIPQNPRFYTSSKPIVSDSVTIYYYSTYKKFSVLFATSCPLKDSSLTVNGKKRFLQNNYKELVVEYKNQNDFFKPIVIKAKNIDLKSIVVIHNSNSIASDTVRLD